MNNNDNDMNYIADNIMNNNTNNNYRLVVINES